MSPPTLSPDLAPLPADLSDVVRHLEAVWPEEGVGVLLRRGEAWRVRPLENAYARAQAREPGRYPLSPSTAFFVEPKEWLSVCREADGAGEEVACLFHSHVESGAWLSPEDRAWAAPAGEPLLPGVSYLVVALRGGRAQEARVFWWQSGGFTWRLVTLSP